MSNDIPRSVFYLASRKRWRAKFTAPSGESVTKTTFRTEREAQRWLDEQIGKLRSGQTFERDKRNTTFEQYAEQVFWPLDDIRESTRATQEGIYRNYLQPMWGKRKLRSIDTEEIELWRASLASTRCAGRPKTTLAANTQHSVYWVFHKIIESAVGKRGYLDFSPLPEKSGLPEKPRSDVQPLEPHEIELLAAACPAFADFIYFLAYSGCRIAEACALRVNDIDRAHSQIRVDEQMRNNGVPDKRLKRSRAYRVVPIAPDVMDMLIKRVDEGVGWTNDEAFIFVNIRGGKRGGPLRPQNFRSRHFQPAAAQCGLGEIDELTYTGITPHDLRHTAVSAWLDEGFDLAEVARFIGDSLQVTYDTYSHLFQARLTNAAQRMNPRVARGREDAKVVPIRKRRAG